MTEASATGETKVQRLERRRAALKQERNSWTSHWRELSEFVQPRKGRYLVTDRNKGDKRNQRIINNTATLASGTLGAGMMSGLTSPARPWFRLTTPDPDLAELASVKEYLFKVERRMYDVFSRSNLYNVLPSVYTEIGNYGSAAMIELEDDEKVVRFQQFTIGAFMLGVNEKQEVDTLCREFSMTVRALVREFCPVKDGKPDTSNLSLKLRGLIEGQRWDEWVEVVHLVCPNEFRQEGYADNRNLPFHECYYEAGTNEDKLLREAGYYEFPAMAPRWEIVGEDIYGSDCPGMKALGDVKQLQHQELRKGEVIDKIARPPMSAPTSLRNQPASILPGDVTFVDTVSGQGGFQPVYTPNPQALVALREDIQEVQWRIKRAYFEDIFLMLANDERTQPPTAEEVVERRSEKLLMLGPVLERLNVDLLDRIIDRTFNIMLRRGLFADLTPPAELEGVDLKVEYISILATAQKLVATGGIRRTAMFVGELAAINPEVVDKFDFDQAVDEFAQAEGTPPRLIRDDDAVAKKRAERAQQLAQQNAMAMAQPAADAAKKLSEAKVGGDEGTSMLDAVVNGGLRR